MEWLGQLLSIPLRYGNAMPINSQRYFMYKENYELRKANPNNRFRCFDVKCACYKLTLTARFDE